MNKALTESPVRETFPPFSPENTPLETVRFLIHGVPRNVRLKLESKTAAGSSKQRTAAFLIADLDHRGLLRPDSIIVESTSGNLGVAMAMICKQRGLQFIAVVDSKASAENLEKLRSYGATLELVTEPDPFGGYLPARLRRVQQLIASSSRSVWTDQYSNPANPLAHYRGTGPEILAQSRGAVQAVFVPVSTGGTLAGVGRYFREMSPATVIVGVDAAGSVVLGGPPGTRKLTGIGSSRRSAFPLAGAYDEPAIVRDADAFLYCRALHDRTGYKVGGSSGAALYACASFLERHSTITDVACVCPDGGENYASTVYNDAWLARNGFELVLRQADLPRMGLPGDF